MIRRTGLALAQSALALLIATAYFIGPIFILGVLTFGMLFWSISGVFGSPALGYGLLLAVPLWILASLLAVVVRRIALGLLCFFFAGAAAASTALGGSALLSHAGLLVIGFAGACSALGWLTVNLGARPKPYEDALHGHTFEELAELLSAAEPLSASEPLSDPDRTRSRR